MAGGMAMHVWAAADPEGAVAALLALPAIDARLVARVAADFPAGGYPAMLEGAFTGIPYKIYAVVAGETAMRLDVFTLMTPLMRLPRFLMAVALVSGARRVLPSRFGSKVRMAILAGFWLAFYTVYFNAMA